MRTPGLVDRHSASRVLLVISLILWCVLGLRYQKYRETLVHISKSQLPEPWTYALQDIGPMERYLLDLPQPFFRIISEQQKTAVRRHTQEEFYKLAALDPQWKFRSLEYIRFSRSYRLSRKKRLLTEKKTVFPLNSATAEALEKVSGIGPVLASRIIKYRTYLGGFSLPSQCYEVYGLDSLVVQQLLKQFRIEKIPQISQIDLDTVSYDKLVRLPYMDRELAKRLVLWRTRWGTFPIDSLERLVDRESVRIQRLALYLK